MMYKPCGEGAKVTGKSDIFLGLNAALPFDYFGTLGKSLL